MVLVQVLYTMPGKLAAVIEDRNMQRLQRSLLWSPIASGILLLGLLSCSFVSLRGASTREEVVNNYLRALANKDEQSIKRLIPENYDVEQVVHEKVVRLGNRKLEQVEVSYQELQKPDSVKVTIEGIYYDKPGFEGKRLRSKDQLFLHAAGNRWYLILGKRNSS